MSTPNFKTVWTRYLFNKNNAPTKEDLLKESLIRDNSLEKNKEGFYFQTTKEGDPFEISAVEFMTTGPGKFVNGAVFSVVKNFFTLSDYAENRVGQKVESKPVMNDSFLRDNAHRGQTDENGSLSFDLKTMLALNEWITSPKSGFKDEPNKGRNISQRHFRPEGESNYDFAQRVQLFESTYFQIGSAQDGKDSKNYDEHVKFVLHADDRREIKNFVVTPRAKWIISIFLAATTIPAKNQEMKSMTLSPTPVIFATMVATKHSALAEP